MSLSFSSAGIKSSISIGLSLSIVALPFVMSSIDESKAPKPLTIFIMTGLLLVFLDFNLGRAVAF